MTGVSQLLPLLKAFTIPYIGSIVGGVVALLRIAVISGFRLNAPFPTLLRLEGRVNVPVSPHAWKLYAPIRVRVLGNDTEDKFSHM